MSLATVDQQSSLYLILDNGNTVKPNNYTTTASSGSRALVTYHYTNILAAGSTYYGDVDIFDYRSILTKDIYPLSDSTSIDFGSDSFFAINQITLSGGFLNAIMSIKFGTIPHLINLVADSVSTDGTTFYLSLRQNAYNDITLAIITSIASFDLSYVDDIMNTNGATESKLNISVNINGSDYVYNRSYYLDNSYEEATALADSLYQYTEYIQ